MKKEKTVKTYQRRTKSGKIVTVRQHTASYDAADKAKDAAKRKGAGKELEEVKAKKSPQKADLFDGYDFTKDDFNEWYEGTGSAADKKVAKALRKTLGRKAYNELNNLAADNYKKGGANSFFKKNVHSTATAVNKASTATDLASIKVPKGYTLQGKPRPFKDDEGKGHKVSAINKDGYKVTLYRYDDATAKKLGENNKQWNLEFGSETPIKSSASKKGAKKKDKTERVLTNGEDVKSTETRSITTKRTTSKGDYTPAFRDYVKKSGYELNEYGVLLKGGKPVENGRNIMQSFAKAYRSGSKPTLPKQSSGRLTAVEKAYADYHKEQGRKGKPDYSSEEFMDFASTYKKQGSPRASKKTTAKTGKSAKKSEKETYVEAGGKKGHKAVPKSSYKKYKEDPAYERRLEKDPKFASSEAVKGAKAELRGYGKQTPASIARQYGKDSKEYKGYMKLYSTPVPKDPKKAAVRNAVLQGFGRAGDDTCRDLLVANGYPHTHAYSKGVKEITALAKKYGIDW